MWRRTRRKEERLERTCIEKEEEKEVQGKEDGVEERVLTRGRVRGKSNVTGFLDLLAAGIQEE